MASRFEDNFDAVIFDMDGTILDSMPWWRQLNYDFLTRRGLEPPQEIRADLKSIATRAAGLKYIEAFKLDMTIEEIIAEHRACMKVYYQTKVQPKAHIRQYLDHLKKLGKRVCVGTATPCALALPALERHGLVEPFEFILSGHDLNLPKDKPDFYLEAARRLHLPPDRCLMVEDSLYAIQGARAAGMWTLAIREEIQKNHQAEIRAACHLYAEDFGQLCV